MPRHPGGGVDRHVHVELVGEPAYDGHGIGPPGLATGAPPAGPVALAGDHGHQVLGLHGHGVQQRGQLVLGRPSVHTEDRRRASVDGERDGADLEERDALGPAADVAHGRLEQPRQQSRGVGRLLGGQRVGQAHGPAQHVVVGQPQRVERGVPDEREGEDLDVALAREHAADATPQPLAAGEAPAGGAGGSTDGTLT